MADTIRTEAEILALHPLQATGDINPQDVRDAIVSAQNRTEKDAAGGYPGLDENALIDPAELASGTPDNTKFPRGDGVWAVPATAEPTFRSGQYYGGLITTSLSVSGGVLLVANTIYAMPLFVPDSTSFDRIGLEIITAAAAGKLFRVGIYSDDGALSPDELVVDSGALAADTPGIALVQATISQSLRGLYWLVVLSDGAPTVRATPPGAAVPILGQDVGNAVGATVNIGLNRWEGTYTYAALPAAWSSVTSPAAAKGNAPLVVVRAA
jgi:hypothetical protein